MADKLVPLAFSSVLVYEECDRSKAGLNNGRLWLSRSGRLLSDSVTPEDFLRPKGKTAAGVCVWLARTDLMGLQNKIFKAKY